MKDTTTRFPRQGLYERPKKLTAQDLIDLAAPESSMPDAEAIAELKKLFDHNDRQTAPTRRVGRQAAIRLLRARGFACGDETLDRVCRALGRASYVKP